MKLKQIRVSRNEDVYDITVKDNHNFFANGVLVHNCAEISLKSNQFCNLCEINAGDILDQADFEERTRAAAFIGTLQAGYTEFHYLRPIWRKNQEKDALLGVSMTGIASGVVMNLDLKAGAKAAVEENKRVAAIIGINPASRVTTTKPSGTSSLVLGTSSGVHAWHNNYYLRRIRVGKNEAIYQYLSIFHPELVENEYFRPKEMAVIGVPQKAPEGATLRTESPIDTLNRVKTLHKNWIKPGHNKGKNTHNVSCTISIRPDEWSTVGAWMWENKDYYSGISVLPYDGGSYIQAPFEDITKERYEELVSDLHSVDLSEIIEESDNTDLQGEAACSGAEGCVVI
jgi:ribonucleoside-diphosphate reductase alpha chain